MRHHLKLCKGTGIWLHTWKSQPTALHASPWSETEHTALFILMLNANKEKEAVHKERFEIPHDGLFSVLQLDLHRDRTSPSGRNSSSCSSPGMPQASA